MEIFGVEMQQKQMMVQVMQLQIILNCLIHVLTKR